MIHWIHKSMRIAFLAALLLAGSSAWAAYTCSVTVSSISVVYSPTVATENISTGTVTVSCTRLMGDPATLNYSVRANNGLQPTGAINRVQLGASTDRYQYELYRQTPYTNPNRWQNNAATQIAGTLNFGAALSATDTRTFDLRLAGSQAVRPAGTYTDTVTATLRDTGTGTILATTTLSVSVITTNSCEIETSPGAMSFAYTSFQAAAAAASTNFSVRCTTGLPYTLALDATSGTLLGLNYSLALSAASATGTGVVQNYSISGTIAASQAGTCGSLGSCSGSQTRTLTITY
ncbi:MAG: spore coat protein U domain-containing protein [Betaproteobacteria bacterium]|nr:spore coat protein U domain-containing protein [Betaproteobacteria bacterium]